MKPFFVYMLRCSDGSFYAGHTDDLDVRLRQHELGSIGYTSSRKPVELVWRGEFETREGALAFELRIKRWSRAKKEALIAGDWQRISELAKSPSTGSVRTVVMGESSTRALRTDWGGSPSTGSVRTDEGATDGQPRGVSLPVPVRAEPVEALLTTNRRAIAKAITLLESTRPDHRAQADELLTALLPHTGKSFRMGLSGVPGVGKSTFIEALGLHLIAQGHKVAVLAVDPSSSVSGGSILGDKTRMEQLSVHPQAFIRPSPARGNLGGVAEHTREAMLVLEAAGFDVVIVETVGVGQSEVAVQGMTDLFVLMQLPNAGDDLQAIKKGVMELADLVLINKADIDPDAATRAQAQITSAMRIFGMHGKSAHAAWQPRVMQLSALKNTGVSDFWAEVRNYQQQAASQGWIESRRKQQATAWMWDSIHQQLRDNFMQKPQVREQLSVISQQVLAGSLPASAAARFLIDLA